LPAISANGRYVAFESAASNLAAGDPNRCQPPSQDIFCTGDVFVRDRRSRKTERVSVAPDGSQSDGDSASAAVSADGRYVAFVSGASNLVAGDTNDHGDVFVRDRQSTTIERASVAADGTEADASSGSPAVSADGRYVAFDSTASNLVGLNANNAEDVFVRDLQSGAIERVSVVADGVEDNGPSASPAISADGRYVRSTRTRRTSSRTTRTITATCSCVTDSRGRPSALAWPAMASRAMIRATFRRSAPTAVTSSSRRMRRTWCWRHEPRR
jgi:Tol biopolymer transport system component